MTDDLSLAPPRTERLWPLLTGIGHNEELAKLDPEHGGDPSKMSTVGFASPRSITLK